MDAKDYKNTGTKIGSIDSLTFEALEARILSLPKTTKNKIQFTPEQDKILLKYWKSGQFRQLDIAKQMEVSVNTCARRYEKLI